jgi:hypothetical protein
MDGECTYAGRIAAGKKHRAGMHHDTGIGLLSLLAWNYHRKETVML